MLEHDENGGPSAVSNYVAVYVDVLGQEERLRGFPKIIEESTSREVVLKALRETYGRVHAVRKLFRDRFAEMERDPKHDAEYAALPDEQKREFMKMRQWRLESQAFSDTILFYATLSNTYGIQSLVPVVKMLYACAMSMLLNLARGVPIRGGVEIGAAATWPEFGMYGSALYSAYDLESRIAKYPRIAVGNELLKYIEFWRANLDNDVLATVNRDLSVRCLRMIREDLDGVPVVHFLGDGVWEFSGCPQNQEHSRILREEHGRGLRFVSEEHEKFKRIGNSELAFRYAMLKSYYLAHSADH
jgi:hypothetical protein